MLFRSRVVVLAIDDIEQSLTVARLVLEHFPQATLVARARNATHFYALRDMGVTLIERETFDAALMSARSVLEALGWRPHQARTLALRFRRFNVAQLDAMAPHWKDEAKLIAAARQGRVQLEELFAQERAAAGERGVQGGWSAGAAAPPGGDAGAGADADAADRKSVV